MQNESKLYAVLLKSPRGQYLHVGIHSSLDEAYGRARKVMSKAMGDEVGEAIDIDLWNTMSIKKITIGNNTPSGDNALFNEIFNGDALNSPIVPINLDDFLDSNQFLQELSGITKQKEEKDSFPDKNTIRELTVADLAFEMKKAKNVLMKKLIEKGDVESVHDIKDLLGSNSSRYILSTIRKNQKQKTLKKSK